ncbi:DUF240 domain-containing protein [Mycoplasmoides pneumoniae]|uniref:MG032/MG096/MG288 family 2 n=1 Tax=Mycoplasmoides pneumoniae TaxID=2104 RepID=A0AB38W8L6_MYCPM|nr:DUF237 domain-containing protein [Mycoplasmoides pneumoniae]VEU57479.1 MG032/MG096/MG288 family 2 [Mycoplasmoides pneumoniae]
MKAFRKLLLGLALPTTIGPLLGLLLTNTGTVKNESLTTVRHRSSINQDFDGIFHTVKLLEPIQQSNADPAASFALFQQKFPNLKRVANSTLNTFDVYNLLSGWKSSLTAYLNQVLALQQRIKAADQIFPNQKETLPKDENPNIFEVLGAYGGKGFFPTLGSNGLHLPPQLFQFFRDFQLSSFTIKDFEVALVSEPDIVQHDKVRYAFQVQFNLVLQLQINRNPVLFDFNLQLKTNNFANQTSFDELFNEKTNPLNWQFFSKLKVNHLVYEGNDITQLANTLLQSQFNVLQLDLNKSIYRLNLNAMAQRFEHDWVQPLYAKRTQAKIAYEAEQARIAAENKRKELERQKLLAELKAKAEHYQKIKQARENMLKGLKSITDFVKFWKSPDRLLVGFNKQDDITTRAGVYKALQIAYANYPQWTFYLTLQGWKNGSELLLKRPSWTNLLSDIHFQKAFNLKNTVSEQTLGAATLPGYGYYGLRMSDWLRWALGYYSYIHMGVPQNVQTKFTGTPDNEQQVWIANEPFEWNKHYGVGPKYKDKAYRFNMEISFELEGWIAVKWWAWAFKGSIPGNWKGKLKVTHLFDGMVPVWELGPVNTHLPQYSFTDQQQLLFVPHSIQKIEAIGADKGINDLLKTQNLHNLERLSYESTNPIDLISYLLYAIQYIKV